MPLCWRQLPSPAPVSAEGYVCGTTEGQGGAHQQGCSAREKATWAKGTHHRPALTRAGNHRTTQLRQHHRQSAAPTPHCTAPRKHTTLKHQARPCCIHGCKSVPALQALGPCGVLHAFGSSVRAGEAVARGYQCVDCCVAVARAISMSGDGVCAALHGRSLWCRIISRVGVQCAKN